MPLNSMHNMEDYDRLEQENEKLKADVARLRECLADASAEYKKLPHSLGYTITHAQRWDKLLSETAPSDSWLKERDAKVLENAANRFRNENYTLLPSTIECAETLETWANELRSNGK
jgi:hypothetical protein